MIQVTITPVSQDLKETLQQKIDLKTKPLGALGTLEQIALRVGQIQNSLQPRLSNPHLLVFAADHGLAREEVSAYPQEVTHQMVLNFLGGGAAINVFCRQHGIELKVIDAGVNFDFGIQNGLIDAKIEKGTASSLKTKAMSVDQAKLAIKKGAEIVETEVGMDCNVIAFGEMGIGNTSAAALVMHYVTGFPVENCVGKGTGLNDDRLKRKLEVLSAVIQKHGRLSDPLDILSTVGGFEIAQMTGAYLQAAKESKLIIVDGFIATAAFSLARMINPLVADYTLFAHKSDEKGHSEFLKFLKAEPILNLGLRLGEGTGSALAYPLIQSAVNFFNEMSSFGEAGVSNKD